MTKEWLDQGEELLGSWYVYVGGEGPTAAKITGQLHVTSQNVRFATALALDENAGIDISNRLQAFRKMDRMITVPFAAIREATITRKFWILKTLHIALKEGGELDLHFGAASPGKAFETIASRLGGG